MPFADPERRRQYQRDYQRAYQKRTGADRARQRKARVERLLVAEWRQCIVGMFTDQPCRKRPRWRDGAALYCDGHHRGGGIPWSLPKSETRDDG